MQILQGEISLYNIIIDNAPGIDDIHGCVLRNCSNILFRPLSIISELAYNTGIAPTE